MNNKDIEKWLNESLNELKSIKKIMRAKTFNNLSPYLVKYAIIRACGAIEVAFKSIVADFCDNKTTIQQLNYYIDNDIRNSSMNPSMDNLYKMLLKFDENWNNNFKNQLSQETDRRVWESSLKSLNNERNKFAHGTLATTLSINDVILYFSDSIKIIEIFDNVVQ